MKYIKLGKVVRKSNDLKSSKKLNTLIIAIGE